MSFESAERVQDASGRQYHIGLAPGEVAPRVLLVGDPARADRIARRFDVVRLTRRSREYVTHTGTLGGAALTVMATGMGCDNTEIAVIEILNCCVGGPAPTLIRVGSSGALQPEIAVGEVAITSACFRLENTSLGFVDPGYPAAAHHEVLLALISAAAASAHPFHVGITATAPGFYGWQGRRGQPVDPIDPDLPERLRRQGVMNFEMEASALFILAARARIRAGAVCAVFANRPENRFISAEAKEPAEDRAIDIALGALRILDAMDAARGPDRYYRLDPPR